MPLTVAKDDPVAEANPLTSRFLTLISRPKTAPNVTVSKAGTPAWSAATFVVGRERAYPSIWSTSRRWIPAIAVP